MNANDIREEYAAAQCNTRHSQRDVVRVLFLQSQTYFGSDSMIHSLIMSNLNRDHAAVYAACNRGSGRAPSASLKALERLENLHLRPTYFGPTLNGVPKVEVARMAITGGPLLSVELCRLARYIKHNQIDIIHGTEKPRDAFYGVLLAKVTGAKSVIHLHVKCEDWISPLVRWAMGQADAIIGVSRFVADSAIAYGYHADRTYAVLNSIDASQWDPQIDGSAVRREFNIAPDMAVLSIISRLFHWKGHTELLKALALVKERTPRFRLLLVGEDDPRATPGRGSYTSELKALAQELGLTDHVVFTGFRKDVKELLAASDVYAMPSFEEPCAVAFLEAMAMAKPIVALESGGTSQLVDQGKAGFLARPGDISALADYLALLIEQPALRQSMGIYARERVKQYFTPQRLANDVEQVYRSILADK